MPAHHDYDYLVIGSGFGGSVAALRLAEKGYRVAVLEQGRHWTPDTLPHNGAVITLLAVTGLSHRQSYGDIFAITIIKTMAVFVAIAVFYMTGLV